MVSAPMWLRAQGVKMAEDRVKGIGAGFATDLGGVGGQYR
jgi:hypothetical protein